MKGGIFYQLEGYCFVQNDACNNLRTNISSSRMVYVNHKLEYESSWERETER